MLVLWYENFINLSVKRKFKWSMRIKECVYCGKLGPFTRDHVPPKCLFIPPLPPNLITVPACSECHASFKMDDEYFRLCLSMRPDVVSTPHGKELWEISLRSLTKPEAVGLKNLVISSLRTVTIHSEDGECSVNTPGFKVDKRRFKLTARRILYGLYFKVKGYRIPQGYDVSIYYEEFQKDLRRLQSQEFRDCMDALNLEKTEELGDVIRFRCATVPEDPKASFWVIQLLNSMSIFGFVIPSCR